MWQSCAIAALALLTTALAPSDTSRLHALFDQEWAERLRLIPELATLQGVHTHDTRWLDYSSVGVAEWHAHTTNYLTKAQNFRGRGRLRPEDRLNLDLFTRVLQQELERQRFPEHQLLVTNLEGPQHLIPTVLASMPKASAADLENVLTRLSRIPSLLDQIQTQLETGLRNNVTPSQSALGGVPRHLLDLVNGEPMASPLLISFVDISRSIPQDEQARLRARATQVFIDRLKPAFEKLAAFIQTKYIPNARMSLGFNSLPDGERWYAQIAQEQAGRVVSFQALYADADAEAARLRSEIVRVLSEENSKRTIDEFIAFLNTAPEFQYASRDEVLAAYRTMCKRIDPEMPRLFGKLPRTPYGVFPTPLVSEDLAYYEPPALDGSRAGSVFINVRAVKAHKKWDIARVALHEGVPGHHLQIALSSEASQLPPFRRQYPAMAFMEGWGIYAEELGFDIDIFDDQFSRVGKTYADFVGAVVDRVEIGVNAFGWSRERALNELRSVLPFDGAAEMTLNRIASIPGQTLTYRSGATVIKTLRREAEQRLGNQFDVRQFHDAVLENGAVPLDILETQVRAYIVRKTTQ